MPTYSTAYLDRIVEAKAVLRDGTIVVEAFGHGASAHVQAVPRGGAYMRVGWPVLRALVGLGRVRLYDLPMIPADVDRAPPRDVDGKPADLPLWRWRQLQRAAGRGNG